MNTYGTFCELLRQSLYCSNLIYVVNITMKHNKFTSFLRPSIELSIKITYMVVERNSCAYLVGSILSASRKDSQLALFLVQVERIQRQLVDFVLSSSRKEGATYPMLRNFQFKYITRSDCVMLRIILVNGAKFDSLCTPFEITCQCKFITIRICIQNTSLHLVIFPIVCLTES